MRRLFWCVAIVALLWTAYWFVAAQGIERGLGRWLELRRGEGWQAELAQVDVSGFPLRFETALDGIVLVDPETGLGWEAPGFGFGAPAYAPTRVHADWPGNQRLLTPYEVIDIKAAEMRAELGLVPGAALVLDSANISLADLALSSSEGWESALETGTLRTERTEADPLAHDIRFSAGNFRPARFVLTALDPTGRLPEVLTALDLDMRATFDAPWDRHAIEDRRPQPTALDIRKLVADWGDMRLEAAGAVTLDAQGVPEGKVTVRAVNWREMLEIARAGGWLPTDLLPTIERGLEVLAGLSGNPETIDAPLSFRGGLVTIGPIPLGPAPILRLR